MGADVKILAGCSKRLSSKAAADGSTGGVASGYVEDAFEARTTLADFFSIRYPSLSCTAKGSQEKMPSR